MGERRGGDANARLTNPNRQNKVSVRSLEEPIDAGEEILVDYGSDYWASSSSSEPDIDSDEPLDQVKRRLGVKVAMAIKSSKPKFKVSAIEESEEEKRDEDSSEEEFIRRPVAASPQAGRVKKSKPYGKRTKKKRARPKLRLGRGGLRIGR